jgi:hypothetical protein
LEEIYQKIKLVGDRYLEGRAGARATAESCTELFPDTSGFALSLYRKDGIKSEILMSLRVIIV